MIHPNSRPGYGRRDFLRLAAYSSLAVSTIGLLEGCGGGGGSSHTSSGRSQVKYQVRYLFAGSNTNVSRSRSVIPAAGHKAKTRQAAIQSPLGDVQLGKINQKGEVAADTNLEAALYRDGAVVDLGMPVVTLPDPNGSGNSETSYSWSIDLNDNNQVLIQQFPPYDGHIYYWLWDNGSVNKVPFPYLEYEFIGNGMLGQNGTVYGTLTKPLFVGVTEGFSGLDVRAYASSGGTYRMIGPQGAAMQDINDSGQMVASRADRTVYSQPFTTDVLLWQDENNYTSLGNLDTSPLGQTVRINNGGDVLAYLSGGGQKSLLWVPNTPNGTTGSSLPFVGVPAEPAFFHPTDLNDHRDIVGTLADGLMSDGYSPQNPRAAVISGGDTTQTPVDLNTVIPADSGWVLTSAAYINNAGWITGMGTYNGVGAAFVLVPVSQASTPATGS